MALIDLPGLNDRRPPTAEFGKEVVEHIAFEQALASADEIRLMKIPRGAYIKKVELAVAVVGSGNVDIGYDLGSGTDDTDYWFDAQAVTTVGRFFSRPQARPRLFDEADSYILMEGSAALAATARFDIFVHYEWLGGA